MAERWIHDLHVEDAGTAELAVTRDRLKDRFPRNATRRMTHLGLLLGAMFEPLRVGEEDALVYASMYAETRALEDYLTSFPEASPTLFQTSIHPSAVQQALIMRRQPLRQFFPLTGADDLPLRALQVALTADTDRVILCGGEERGSWLRERGCASEATYAYAAALTRSPEGALGRLAVTATDAAGAFTPLAAPEFFRRLQSRQDFRGPVAPGFELVLEWS